MKSDKIRKYTLHRIIALRYMIFLYHCFGCLHTESVAKRTQLLQMFLQKCLIENKKVLLYKTQFQTITNIYLSDYIDFKQSATLC
jgi:hypothetical protein